MEGYLQHVESSLFVHPEGGVGVSQAKLVFGSASEEERLRFILHPDGALEHKVSGAFAV